MSDDSYEAIRYRAIAMYQAENPDGAWEAEDETTRLYWMKRAALRLRIIPEEDSAES